MIEEKEYPYLGIPQDNALTPQERCEILFGFQLLPDYSYEAYCELYGKEYADKLFFKEDNVAITHEVES